MPELIYLLVDGIVVLALIASGLVYVSQARRLSTGLLKRVFSWLTLFIGLLALFMFLANSASVGFVFSWSTEVLHLLALIIALSAFRSAGLFMQFAHRYGFHQKVHHFVHVRHHSVRKR